MGSSFMVVPVVRIIIIMTAATTRRAAAVVVALLEIRCMLVTVPVDLGNTTTFRAHSISLVISSVLLLCWRAVALLLMVLLLPLAFSPRLRPNFLSPPKRPQSCRCKPVRVLLPRSELVVAEVVGGGAPFEPFEKESFFRRKDRSLVARARKSDWK